MAVMTEMALEVLEPIAADAVRKVSRVWQFLHSEEPPAHAETMVRSWVIQGAPTSSIVGAVLIAAQRGIALEQQLVYANGVLKRELAQAPEIEAAVAEVNEVPKRWWKRWSR